MKRWNSMAALLLAVLLLVAAGCGGGATNADRDSGIVDEPEDSGDEAGDFNAEDGDEPGSEGPAENGEESESGGPMDAVTVTVTPPEGWEEEETTSLLQYRKGLASFMVMKDTYRVGSEGLDGYLVYSREAFSNMFSDIDFVSEESMQVDGCQARKILMAYNAGIMDFKMLVVFVLRGNEIYSLQGTALAEDFEAVRPDFEAFIGSCRFE